MKKTNRFKSHIGQAWFQAAQRA